MTPRETVLVCVTTLHGGGAEAVGVAWLGWLADQGHRVVAVLLSDGTPHESLADRVELIDLAGLRHSAKVRALRRLVVARRATAVVALQTYPNLLAIAARLTGGRGPVTVISEHNLISLGLPGAGPSHRLKIRLAKWSYGFADHVMACSHPVAAEMVSAFGVAGHRCTVVPNPALPASGLDIATRVPDEEGEVIDVVIAGRLAPQKRPRLAVDVVAHLIDCGMRARLVVFGDGPLKRELLEYAARNAVPVVDHGWVQDWSARLTPGSVLLLASSREGFGNVLIEAAARGIPSVAVSGALGVADAVVPGISGELALDGSVESLAAAVERAARLPVSGLKPWLGRFTPDSSGRALLASIGLARANRKSGSR